LRGAAGWWGHGVALCAAAAICAQVGRGKQAVYVLAGYGA
jgi:hypothetical protein